MPRPLANPRTNPLETKSRRLGEVKSKGLSVQRGVQGRMIRSTPKVAHMVTNRRYRRRSSHMCTFSGVREVVRAGGLGGSAEMGCASRDVVAGGVVGSTLNTHSSHTT